MRGPCLHTRRRAGRDATRRLGAPCIRLTLGAALTAAAALLLSLPAAAHALEQKLVAADGHMFDDFGRSVAIDGDTAVVGAPGANGDRGAAYVFARSGDGWTQTAKLIASDGAADDFLGSSVAIDGGVIVAGADGDNVGANSSQGSLYIFSVACPASPCNETAKLVASDGAAGDDLGYSVAIDGETIVAGAWLDDVGANTHQGSAYTFSTACPASPCDETAKLVASDGVPEDNLGHSVAIDGDTIVVGTEGAIQGSAYTFSTVCFFSPCTETAKLVASGGAGLFGISVAIDGDTIVAGAFLDDVGGNFNQGSAYTFSTPCSASPCTETAKLFASDGASSDRLGYSVAIDGEAIVVGSHHDDVGANQDQGSAYTFSTPCSASSCTETAKLVAPDGAADDALGRSVAIDGETIIAGAPRGPSLNPAPGSASIFFPRAQRHPGGGAGGGAGPAPAPATIPCPEGTSPTVICTRDAQGRLHYQGTDADETFAGTKGDDVMVGEGGRDEMDARAGEDELLGGAGKDKLEGGGGRDTLKGGGGRDSLKGNGGRDQLSGQGGRDRLKGGGGRDRLRGGKGKDNLSGQGGKDRLKGNAGRDRFSGGGGNDRINAKGQRREKVGCGEGKKDRVKHAKGDRVKRSCERVRR